MQVEIRPEILADHPAVFNVHHLAFEGDTEARLVEALRRQPNHIPELSLVALVGDAIVGHVIFSPASIHSDTTSWPALALGPVAVAPAHQRLGIGGNLIRGGLEVCQRLGHSRVIVLGHPEYYPRFGFSAASRWGIRSPFEAPDDAYMALALTSGALDGCEGVVAYSQPFNDL